MDEKSVGDEPPQNNRNCLASEYPNEFTNFYLIQIIRKA